MEDGEDKLAEDNNVADSESADSDMEGSEDGDTHSPSSSEGSESRGSSESLKVKETDEPEYAVQEADEWNGPEELELVVLDGESRVLARWAVTKGLSWGPYKGNFQNMPCSPGTSEMSPPVTLVLEDQQCWLARLPLVSSEADANSVIYRKGEEIWCRTTRAVSASDPISAFLVAEPQAIPNYGVKLEPDELHYPASLHSGIQLLPQQAGMAAILATAVVNKDVFPCKDCGIWYRSERNLQAHLMYYCASRQNPSSPSVDEKPKESYPNERLCPFPQCKKSCPSASSLEIHMRSHSGERPFVCLICLSAFTTKANCERHLKVHTDSLNGICRGCGFISTTRDILCSHLVTNHVACQPDSKGEVYSPSTGLTSTQPLAQGLCTVTSSSTVKCCLCGFVADGLTGLQQHALVHVPPGATQSVNPSPAKMHQPALSPTSCEHTPKRLQLDQAEIEESKNAADIPCSSTQETILLSRIKEEPDLNQCVETESESGARVQCIAMKSDAETSLQSPSSQSHDTVKVKAEVVSPTPGSSPVPQSDTSMLPTGGTVFLPQYVFGNEAAVVPQASEILAKMSELVHSRLKQGQGVASNLYAGAPIQKGATCFECEITFNNINNYYVHKRLYCSGRHLPDDSPPSVRKLKATTNKVATTTGIIKISQPAAVTTSGVSGVAGDIKVEASMPAMECKLPEVKSEESVAKDTSSEGDSTSRMSDDSQSPGSSVDDQEEDPSKTVCEACNIRFSRHETYMVHKRYYCASRHDPPSRRANTGRVPFLPQAVRTRKRRKMYEIHAAASQVSLPTPQLTEASSSHVPVAQTTNVIVANPVETPVGVSHTDALPLFPGLITVPKADATPSPSSSPDTEGPIDLSKKPRLQTEVLPTTALVPLADYHECTPCRISFNSLESYLAHKKYYCPAITIKTQLQKIKCPRAASVSNQSNTNATENADIQGEDFDLGRVKVERRLSLSPGAVAISSKSMTVPAAFACVADLDSLPRYGGAAKVVPKAAGVPTAICPYCPLSGPIKGDLIQHFKHVHGLQLTNQALGHSVKVNFMEEATATRIPVGCVAEGTLQFSGGRSASSPQQPVLLSRAELLNGKETITVSSSNRSPLQTSSPRSQMPSSPNGSLNISPMPDAVREASLNPHTPPMHTDKSVQTPKGLMTPLPNGNHRFCRLCNIRFSSLSTFIAHKKYYCSSHAAEHVK